MTVVKPLTGCKPWLLEVITDSSTSHTNLGSNSDHGHSAEADE
ncbi:hypothetical protein SynBIOSE41_01859 [Synechococcus sp. BIOS-E4-1]|nr:hypothetical protein SynBIOSE41_01859 [Synechococcus sp. BIOS-E4-1]